MTRRSTTMTDSSAKKNGARDFDFLMGDWTIHNRYLRERLKGSTDWVEFESTYSAHPILGGAGNEDEYRPDYWPGFSGMTIRFFNPAMNLWSIYWADNRRNVLDPSVVGRFDGNTAVFEGPDLFEGRPIRMRFDWTIVDATHVRWEQSFSDDGGTTWEKNWV